MGGLGRGLDGGVQLVQALVRAAGLGGGGLGQLLCLELSLGWGVVQQGASDADELSTVAGRDSMCVVMHSDDETCRRRRPLDWMTGWQHGYAQGTLCDV